MINNLKVLEELNMHKVSFLSGASLKIEIWVTKAWMALSCPLSQIKKIINLAPYLAPILLSLNYNILSSININATTN